MVYQFTIDNLPAFRDEAYITSIRDYQIRIDFQLSKFNQPDGKSENLVSTWPLLNNQLLKTDGIGKYIKSSEGSAKKYIKDMNLTTLDIEQKIEKISESIKSDFEWNGDEYIFSVKTPKEFQEQKGGNCSEINLFMLACLNAAEIEAYPVILSTRDHGKIYKDYPFLHFFNYIMINAKNGDKQYLLDATDIFLPYDRIPINCINESGLIVKERTQDWIDLSSFDRGSAINEKFDIEINPSSDSLEIHAKLVSSGYDASSLKSKTGIRYEKIKEEISSRGFHAMDSIDIENFIDRKKDYILEFSGRYPMEKIGNNLFLSPFFHEPLEENLLKSPNRQYPVDFVYRKIRQFETNFKVPAGYRVSYMPEKYSVDHGLVKIYYSATISGDAVTVKGMYEFKKSVYRAVEYKDFRFFLSQIVKRFNDKIILEKIPES